MFKKVKSVKEKEEEQLKKKLSDLQIAKDKLISEIEYLLSEYESIKKDVQNIQSIYKLKGIISEVEKRKEKLTEIERKEAEIIRKLVEVKRDLKSIEIIESKREKEQLRKEIAITLQQIGFFHLIKKSIGAFLLFSIILFGQTAPQKALKEEFDKSIKKDFQEVLRIIEEKIKVLQQERKKLEALKKTPITEEEKKKVEKIVKAVEKAPADEIAPAIENLPPRLAAEVILRLKPRKAGEILSNMNPEKASQIIKFVLSQNPELGKKLTSVLD